MNRFVPLVVGALLVVLGTAGGASAQVTPLTVAPTPADTDSVLLLHGAFTYPGYWWDHTRAHGRGAGASEGVRRLARCRAPGDRGLELRAEEEFGGLITLTDVTDQYTAKHKADIVLHYNPTAGGTVFGGYAICGEHTCPNVIVRSDLPPSLGLDPYSPQYLYYVTMHELGHALGLGHGEPLFESTDLMGYGWSRANGIVPTLSECDIEGIGVVFAWALQGVDPYPPTDPRVFCHD